jgi:hypothetical protein
MTNQTLVFFAKFDVVGLKSHDGKGMWLVESMVR